MHFLCGRYAHLVESLHAVAREDRRFRGFPLFVGHPGHGLVELIDHGIKVPGIAAAVIDTDAEFFQLLCRCIRRSIQVGHRAGHRCCRFRAGNVLFRQSQEGDTGPVCFLAVARSQSGRIRHRSTEHIDVGGRQCRALREHVRILPRVAEFVAEAFYRADNLGRSVFKAV